MNTMSARVPSSLCPLGQSGRDIELTTHLQLAPKLKMRGAIHPLLLRLHDVCSVNHRPSLISAQSRDHTVIHAGSLIIESNILVNINFKLSTLLKMPTPSRDILQHTQRRNFNVMADEMRNVQLVEVTDTDRLKCWWHCSKATEHDSGFSRPTDKQTNEQFRAVTCATQRTVRGPV